MHFRQRAKGVQVIRTKYDPKTKKGKNEIVGRIMKAKPEISEELKKACTPEELKEVKAWLEQFAGVQRLRIEYAAKSLPEQLATAAEWFATQKSEEARLAARSVMSEWASLRSVLRRQGFIE